MKICKRHKGYKAIRRPRSMCPVCWDIYLDKHPEEKKRNEKFMKDLEKLSRTLGIKEK